MPFVSSEKVYLTLVIPWECLFYVLTFYTKLQWDSLISPTKSISFNDAQIENLWMRTIYGQKPKRPTNKPKHYQVILRQDKSSN